jgi:hypothetical protein
MPEGQRLAPAVVLEWLELRFGSRWLALPVAATRRGFRAAVAQGIRGGALYDALIAIAALHPRDHHQRRPTRGAGLLRPRR